MTKLKTVPEMIRWMDRWLDPEPRWRGWWRRIRNRIAKWLQEPA